MGDLPKKCIKLHLYAGSFRECFLLFAPDLTQKASFFGKEDAFSRSEMKPEREPPPLNDVYEKQSPNSIVFQ